MFICFSCAFGMRERTAVLRGDMGGRVVLRNDAGRGIPHGAVSVVSVSYSVKGCRLLNGAGFHPATRATSLWRSAEIHHMIGAG